MSVLRAWQRYSSAIIDLEEGMAGVRRIDLNPPLAKLTIEGSIHIKTKH